MSFHGHRDRHSSRPRMPRTGPQPVGVTIHPPEPVVTVFRTTRYSFSTHYHPFVAQLIHRLIERSVRGLQAADTHDVGTFANGQPRPELWRELMTATEYAPTAVVERPLPVRDLDFTSSGAYSVYNWELFFHVPMAIAVHLSRNQRFAEAQRWLHYIFDPTDDSEGPTPERFWKFRPFRVTDVRLIQDILVNLSTGADHDLQLATIDSIGAWKDAPFRPHLIARYRQSAYMLRTVMTYLDNLIAWGDSLFAQESSEAINEATQLYVLAAQILGRRPEPVPKKGSVRPQNYANLRQDLDAFGNVLRELETDIPFDALGAPPPLSMHDGLSALGSIGRSLYFCIPRNDRLIGYWDKVADRLFKIRNSLNLQGVFRQLPLFDPPIDPGLLARAAAAGLDVGAIVAGLGQPLPALRFSLMLQKALELAQEVKSMGGQLLSALEKADGEALAIMRARQERVVAEMAEGVRYRQLQEAKKSLEGLEVSLKNTAQRYSYYERLLGKSESEIMIPAIDALDEASLDRQRFGAEEPEVARRPIAVEIARDVGDEGGGKLISPREARELQRLADAKESQDEARGKDQIGAALALIPELGVDFHFWGIGGHVSFGGSALSRAMSFWASFARADADGSTYEATNTAKIGSYDRREQDWAVQSNMLAGEMTQTLKQLRAAQIRVSIAEREWKNHQQQIAHAREMEHFLTSERDGKKAGQALYLWMKREVRGLYTQAHQLAHQVAKKAERALQYELGDPSLSFVAPNYLGGREGLLAGEALYLDLKRMELAYHEQNQREYELTRSVSLRELDPRALLQLRATGSCTVRIPEAFFDHHAPGHYLRRLKSVALSLPCVAGPYSSVTCRLTLTSSSVRRSPALIDGVYERTGVEDERFSDDFGRVESVVTSTAQDDAGIFDRGPGGERLLPFERAGAVGEWQLELPTHAPEFDHDTISDAVLHLRYTAREGGTALRDAAVAAVQARIAQAMTYGSVRLLSLRHDFPSEWSRFKAVALAPGQTAPFTLTLRAEHYPFWTRGRAFALARADLFVRTTRPIVRVSSSPTANPPPPSTELRPDAALGRLLVGPLPHNPLPAPVGAAVLHFDDTTMTDAWIALTWGVPGP